MANASPQYEMLAELSAQVLAGPSEDVPSPCVSICVMHPQTGLCEGCLRSLDEIGAWSQMPDEAKRLVWQRIGLRAA